MSEFDVLLGEWLQIIGQPKIVIPLMGGLLLGFLISLCPFMQNFKRLSDKAFYVYMANVVGSGSLFVYTQRTSPLDAVLSLLILVAFSSVFIPWFWFNVWSKRK